MVDCLSRYTRPWVPFLVLSEGLTAVKRHHDQGNSQKRTSFNWGWLTGSEVQSNIIKVRAWQHLGRLGTGGAESSSSWSKESRIRLAPTWIERGSPYSPLLWHTSSNKGTPTPTRPHLPTVPRPRHTATSWTLLWYHCHPDTIWLPAFNGSWLIYPKSVYSAHILKTFFFAQIIHSNIFRKWQTMTLLWMNVLTETKHQTAFRLL